MGRVRLILISLVALVVALGAAFVARGLASPKPKTVIIAAAPTPRPTVRVLVTSRSLAVGDRLDDASLSWQVWPAEGLNAAFITDGGAPAAAPADAKDKVIAAAGDAAGAAKTAITGGGLGRKASFIGAVVREAMVAGEPVVDTKLVRAGAGGVLAVTLQPGMRAMSIPLSAENAAGGFILPGDHVDVVQVRRMPAGVDAATVMRNVRVLAIDQHTRADAKADTQVGSSATLELSPGQSEDMVLARAQGELTLVLRSYADASGDARTGDVNRLPENAVVKVYRDGQVSEVKVTR